MTIEEASKDYSFIIKCLNKRRMTPCGFCKSDKCTPVLSDCTPDDFVINTAIAAIEKQIPKKPNKKIVPWMGDLQVEICTCSVCDHQVERDQTYCEKCGQRIDWSEG